LEKDIGMSLDALIYAVLRIRDVPIFFHPGSNNNNKEGRKNFITIFCNGKKFRNFVILNRWRNKFVKPIGKE
jgi:hypothetical protein